MAFFGGSKKEDKVKTTTTRVVEPKVEKNISSATIITKDSKISGNLMSNDTVQVDGEVDGNISVNNAVLVGKSGVVKGNIKAQRVICSGKIDGEIECANIEVLNGAKVSHKIVSKIVVINGEFNGGILADKVLVDTQGFAKDKIQAKEIEIKGTYEGDLSCQLLTTKITGKIKGNMYVQNILNEGGMVEGSIGQFRDIFTKEPEVEVKGVKKEEAIQEPKRLEDKVESEDKTQKTE